LGKSTRKRKKDIPEPRGCGTRTGAGSKACCVTPYGGIERGWTPQSGFTCLNPADPDTSIVCVFILFSPQAEGIQAALSIGPTARIPKNAAADIIKTSLCPKKLK